MIIDEKIKLNFSLDESMFKIKQVLEGISQDDYYNSQKWEKLTIILVN